MPPSFESATPPRSEDPAVSVVEQMLTAHVPSSGALMTGDGKVVVDHALSICACVTEHDAPTWLICDTSAGELVWCRMPYGIESSDLVEARSSGGGHADPAEVLRWLRGEARHPWNGGSGSEPPGLLDVLRRRINDG